MSRRIDNHLPAVDRIKARISISAAGCWEWQGAINENRYGTISVNGKPRRAHRVSYEAFVGPIPPSLDLDHLCRNRCCVNPDHLEAVTRAENLRRSPTACSAGGATTASLKRAVTHCSKGHPFSPSNTEIRYGKWRRCRECHRSYERERYQRKIEVSE